MKIDAIHRWLLSAVLVVIGAEFYGAYRYQNRHETEFNALSSEVWSLQSQLSMNDEAQEILARLQKPFIAASERGWWRSQDRLGWLTWADRSAKRTGLPLLRYRLLPQVAGRQENDLTVWTTPVDLEMGLIHEGQLLDFWSQMDSARQGGFSLESCRIQRASDRPEPGQANLQALCRMNWFTILQQTHDED